MRWFEICFNLKINYDKCELMGTRMVINSINAIVVAIGRKVGSFPSKYLDLPLCMGLPKRTLWDVVVERFHRKLSTWKGKYLPLG